MFLKKYYHLMTLLSLYIDGQNEIVIGKVFKKAGWKRSEFVVSTKIFWGGPGVNQRGLSRKHIIEGLQASLERMQLDYVDLIFAHRPDPLTPMEEIVRAFNHVINQGKAFYWGTSEWSAQQIQEAHMVAKALNLIGPIMEQPEYNMITRERFEKEYHGLFELYKMGTTVWSPLAGGMLTGKYLNKNLQEGRYIPNNPKMTEGEKSLIKNIGEKWFTGEEGARRMEIIRRLDLYAKEKLQCSTAQLALAWVLRNPNVSSAIVGATKVNQIEENVLALTILPKLTDSVMKDIEAILKNRPVLVQDFREW
jgi:voltage-dependent potassium channel beta subunit